MAHTTTHRVVTLDLLMQKGKPEWWDEAVDHLSRDPLLGSTVELYSEEYLSGRGEIFQTLVRSIVGQQISVKAADTVHRRLEELCEEISMESIASCTLEDLSSCGLSQKKSQYIRGIATSEVPLLPEGFEEMDDESIAEHLVQFNGVGPWTAEMMLMFHFLRQDVFSLGDIGLIRGTQRLVPEAETKDDVDEIAKRWKPYRTAAAWYLWRILDPVPVEY